MFRKFSRKALMTLGTISLIVAIALPTALAAAFNSSTAVLDFDGSTTVFPVTQVAATRFPVDFPDVTTINIGDTGSGHGQSEILAGVVDIGESSSACSWSNAGTNGQPAAIYDCPGGTHLTDQLVDTVFAKDAVTMIANHNFLSSTCGVSDANAHLTKAQLQQIYQGDITDWHAIFSGCPTGTPIVPVARIIGSGTRSSFLKLAGINCLASDPDDAAGNCSPTANTFAGTENAAITATGVARIDANSDVETYVDTHPGSISYIGLAFTDPNNIQFGLDFGSGVVFPNATTVGNNTYGMSRNLHYFTGPTSGSTPGVTYDTKQRVQDYLTWILGPEGQGIVKDVGYLPVATAKPDFDVNGDHNCNVLDLVSIGGVWNQTAPASGNPAYPLVRGWLAQDANFDGHINVLDLVTVGTHWGSGCW